MRSNRIWVFVLTGLAVLAFLAMQRGVSRAMKMKAEATPGAQVAQFKPGDAAKVVLELTRVGDGEAEGRVLEKKTETVYRRTTASARVAWTGSTAIVMGKVPDLHAGAVIHVTGTVSKGGGEQAAQAEARQAAGSQMVRSPVVTSQVVTSKIVASQIVVLTGYVQVQ